MWNYYSQRAPSTGAGPECLTCRHHTDNDRCPIHQDASRKSEERTGRSRHISLQRLCIVYADSEGELCKSTYFTNCIRHSATCQCLPRLHCALTSTSYRASACLTWSRVAMVSSRRKSARKATWLAFGLIALATLSCSAQEAVTSRELDVADVSPHQALKGHE